MVIYITQQGTVLSKKQGKLIVSKEGNIISEIPLNKIDKVNLMGNISLTTPIINYFLNKKIEVIFMTQNGKYRGKLYTDDYKNVLLRLKQYERSSDKQFKLKMAKAIVKGKLKNYYDFLINKSKHLPKGQLGKEIATIRVMTSKIEQAKDIDVVRGLEGVDTKSYFKAFSRLIKNQNFKFEKRTMNPPKDPINAMLSFGYYLLYNEIMAAINIVGLDPYFGNLHTVEVSKKSLLFDLVEEFRNILIDSLVINMINRNEFNQSDFIKKEKNIVHFTEDGMKKFISKYEKWLGRKMRYHLDGETNYIRTIFQKQVRHYARVVLGDEDKYIPFYRVIK
ncbi:CRISPR-associated protein Cas1 [Thermosipho sp. 1063]|uniref:CRISPR-associated endonuclease Cas1 n=1 Tax=unclassified Thermosipho (in: thermotogales) TaxID=2676525 RepID=UPI000949356E|nr:MULTISPECIES: CRISPR-associated endonuclease Cas1 [unclassified Thermosipho (in: thermotogales)]ANQ54515.1 CRISPR-associated protein Cas1 [Thermosipho sp. 1070]APT72957.1 CRISPR-associated protein Cas1 [Thermosipho sp. 1063]OOC42411.1 CRISPR-associated protein Cas1 [Thermosipho sp. 1074]